MHVSIFPLFCVIPESESVGTSTSTSIKVKVAEFFIFMVLVSVISLTILFGGFIHTLLVVFFVSFLLISLVRKVKSTEGLQLSQTGYLLYGGTLAVCVSLLFFTLWVGYCKIAYHSLCVYSTYILCAEVIFLFIMVIAVYKRR